MSKVTSKFPDILDTYLTDDEQEMLSTHEQTARYCLMLAVDERFDEVQDGLWRYVEELEERIRALEDREHSTQSQEEHAR